jgi:hypothetical protein
MHRIGEDGLERAGPLEQALVAIKIEGGRSGGDAERMARIGEAVGKLGHMLKGRAPTRRQGEPRHWSRP